MACIFLALQLYFILGSLSYRSDGIPPCVFSDPDTSVSGIEIRDAESVVNILGRIRLEGDTTYTFYSSDHKQQLELRVHPGDYINQVSIFTISYCDTPSTDRSLPIAEFKTEKGVVLGLTKSQITQKLGSCYTIRDSSKKGHSIYYQLEQPDESRTSILKSHNMPTYYASYEFLNDILVRFEFGFEYP